MVRFLFAWALIDLIEAALYWFMARKLCPKAVRLRHLAQWRQTLAENPGLIRFAFVTHAGVSLDATMLCGLLDAIGAMLGSLIAMVVILGFAEALDLNPDYVDPALWFACAMLWALVSAPTGILRTLHRFDMAVYVEAVVPLGRLRLSARRYLRRLTLR